jgi:hypothetical protein
VDAEDVFADNDDAYDAAEDDLDALEALCDWILTVIICPAHYIWFDALDMTRAVMRAEL